MNELDQLRADLAVLERYQGTEVAKMHCREQIARKLEAEQADPWRDAKGVISLWRTEPDCFLPTTAMIVAYVDHLNAKNEQLAARVAEFEASLPRRFWEHDDMASESVCRGWRRVNVDGEITGGCGKCERCYLAACGHVKTFASEVKLMRKVAELMSKYIDEERLQNVSMEDWINHARRELEGEDAK